eukprot:CAMPEP_0115184812 /NCGR_PEP_ID=MMETSP0270-20121206/9152_1 /TAXON_ID=71861 /ORGANISM="Scrippsiella trochoidea, Strain CCMP3099" /LENGTH=43 /DNA_ID= /DNA_START= /DNA_END= /DNA_ORIENTATION=
MYLALFSAASFGSCRASSQRASSSFGLTLMLGLSPTFAVMAAF